MGGADKCSACPRFWCTMVRPRRMGGIHAGAAARVDAEVDVAETPLAQLGLELVPRGDHRARDLAVLLRGNREGPREPGTRIAVIVRPVGARGVAIAVAQDGPIRERREVLALGRSQRSNRDYLKHMDKLRFGFSSREYVLYVPLACCSKRQRIAQTVKEVRHYEFTLAALDSFSVRAFPHLL